MPDNLDLLAILRAMPPDTDVEHAANIIAAVREATGNGRPPATATEQEAAPLTPAEAAEADQRAQGQDLLEHLEASIGSPWHDAGPA